MKTKRVLVLVVIGLGFVGGFVARAYTLGQRISAYLLATEDAVDRWHDVWVHVEYARPNEMLGWAEQLEEVRAEFAALEAPAPAERFKDTVELAMGSVIELALAMGAQAGDDAIDEKMRRASTLSNMVDYEEAALRSKYMWWMRE